MSGARSALDEMMLAMMDIGARSGSRAGRREGGCPGHWPADAALTVQGVHAAIAESRAQEGLGAQLTDEERERGSVTLPCGLAAATDLAFMVVLARYPALGPEMEVEPEPITAYRIPRETWRVVEGLPHAPVDTEPWLWSLLGEGAQVVGTEGEGGTPISYVAVRPLTRIGADARRGWRLVAIRRVARRTVSVSSLEADALSAGKMDRDRAQGGTVLIGRHAKGSHDGAAEAAEHERGQAGLGALLDSGRLAAALEAGARAVRTRDQRLRRLEAAPERPPAHRRTRARDRREVEAGERATGRVGLLPQWRLPDIARQAAGKGGSEQGEGDRAGRGEGAARAAHGVGAHWKRQPFGAGRAQRRWIHISPYWRGMAGLAGGSIEWMLPQWDETGRPAGREAG